MAGKLGPGLAFPAPFADGEGGLGESREHGNLALSQNNSFSPRP
jgi:hypothetical protein